MIGFEVTNAMVVVPIVGYFATDLLVSLVQWRRRIVDERRRYVVPEPRHQHTHTRVVSHRR